MMQHRVYLHIQANTYQRLHQVQQQLNVGSKERQAKILGEILADLATDVIDQVFTEMIRKATQRTDHPVDHSRIDSSQQVIAKIISAIQQYMPYAVSLMSNDRLKPLIQYLNDCIRRRGQDYYLTYPVQADLVAQQKATLQQVRAGHDQAVKLAVSHLIQIIDIGVNALLIEPKNILKFNVIVNKTLDGVIGLCTRLGYQRLEKVLSDLTAVNVVFYLNHFAAFLQPEQDEPFN